MGGEGEEEKGGGVRSLLTADRKTDPRVSFLQRREGRLDHPNEFEKRFEKSVEITKKGRIFHLKTRKGKASSKQLFQKRGRRQQLFKKKQKAWMRVC